MRAGTMRWAIGLALGLGLGCSDDEGGLGVGDVGDVGDVSFGGETDGANPADTAAGDVGADTGGGSDTGGAPDTGAPGDTGAVADSAGPNDTTGDYAPSLFVDPTAYTFSYISPLAAPMVKQLTLFNTGSAPLDISKIEWAAGSSPSFDIVLLPPLPKRLAPGKETLLTVRFRELGAGTGTLLITSNDPNKPVTSLTFDSYIKSSTTKPEPCVSIEPSRLDFGSLQRGQSKTLNATLRNCSPTEPLQLTAITRSQFFFLTLSQEFQLAPMPTVPQTIPAGGSVPIGVSYTPTLAGLDSGYFAFATNDPNQPQAHLDVSGIGTQPPVEEIGLRVKIAWDTNDTDVDSHLLMPGGALFDCFSDCFFGNPAPDWGTTGDWRDDPFLDVDDVDGFGPENINISEPQPGVYTFIVHYYADSHEGMAQPSKTTVELYSFGVLLGTFGPTTTQSTNSTWDVFTVEWPSKRVTTLGNVYMLPSGSVNHCGFRLP